MEHATITPMEKGYKRIIPDEGYVLLNTVNRHIYSEAVVKNISVYMSIKAGESADTNF